MSDIEKLQRKLLKEAAKSEKLHQQAHQRRRKATETEEPRIERLHCAACLALLTGDKQCPRCDLKRTNVIGYCRKCMYVHASEQACVAWKPKVAE